MECGVDSKKINIAIFIGSELETGGRFQYEYKILDILKNKSCLLPTIEDSCYLHFELFRIFNNHIFKHLNYKVQKCPIT